MLDDRQRLKSILSDCLSGNKLQLNLLLNAYDNDVPAKLPNSANVPDKNLFLQGLVQSLTSDYGITEQAALWAIDSWCLILGVSLLASTQQSNVATVDDSAEVVISQFESFLSSSLKSSTVKNYIFEVTKFINHKSITKIGDITSDDVNDYIENGTEGYSSITSLKRRRCILEKLLKFLANRGFVHPSLLSACNIDYHIIQKPDLNASVAKAKDIEQRSCSNVNYKEGDTIIICEGKHTGLKCIIDSIDRNNGLLKVAVDIFGRHTPIGLIDCNHVLNIPNTVLDKLLEEDDYIDFSLSLKDTYYVIRSPSNEKKAGISFDSLDSRRDGDDFRFVLPISRKDARKKIYLYEYHYSNLGSFIDKGCYAPDYDHYELFVWANTFPEGKLTNPYFVRFVFSV